MAPLVALIALAAAIRFYAIGRQGFWYDETFTVMLVKMPFAKMISTIPRTESTPPLYYSIAWVWARIFGHGTAGLRSLSAVFGVATVPLIRRAGEELVDSRAAGWAAAALAACNPLLIWYSQEARAYALLAMLAAAGLWAFARVLRTGSDRAIAVWALMSILGLLTHYFAAVLVAPEALWLLSHHRRRPAAWIAVACIVLCGCALLPLLIHQNTGTHNGWVHGIPLSARLGQIFPMTLLGTGAPWRPVLKVAAFGLVLASVLLLALPDGRSRLGRTVLALGLTLAGLAISLGSPHTLLARNLLASLIPGLVFLAAAATSSRSRVLGGGLVAALCAIGLIAAGGVDADVALQRPDWQGVADALGPWPATGAARLIIIEHNHGVLGNTPLEDYLPRLTFVNRDRRPGLDVRATEIELIAVHKLKGQGYSYDCWWGSACNLFTSQLRRRYAFAGFHPSGMRVVHQFTILTLTASQPTRIRGREMIAALRGSAPSHDDAVMVQHPG